MREFRFVLTPFCNYKCFFCHSECINEGISLQLTPSDYEFMAKVARDQLVWTTCTLTGGEPLISPIFKEVCERFRRLGIATTVVTNASLLARPEELLKDISQINVSVHTMNPDTYKKITQIGYPLESILNTIAMTREKMPELEIHLNYTVIKGMNDSDEEFEQFLRFARKVRARAKFIDLSTTDENLKTDAREIVKQLEALGFKLEDENAWQYHLVRAGEKTTVTKCPFNGKYEDLPARDVFVDPNGMMYRSYGGYFSVDALSEIKSRDADGLIQKIRVLINYS